MPKDVEQCNNLMSRKAKRSRHHPYSHPLSPTEGSSSKDADINAQKKEWDDAMCPICMEHPHNAVLLLCSSYDKGCCPYMCDTSYRHSNCLDQYRMPRANCRNSSSQGVEVFMNSAGRDVFGVRSLSNMEEVADTGETANSRGVVSESWTSRSEESEDSQNGRASHASTESQSDRMRDGFIRENATDEGETSALRNSRHLGNVTEVLVNEGVELKCPLCRGTVNGWKVVQAVRQYLNLKTRNCSHESCSFNGTYEELRKHARSVHPTARPADVDPSRQRAWRHLEHQRDFGDVLSTIRSAMPTAVVLGDYVIDSEDGIHFDRGDESDNLATSGSWWTTFFLFHMISPIASLADARGLPARWRAARRQHMSSGLLSVQPMSSEHLMSTSTEEADNVSTNEVANGAAGPRRRRRSNRFRPDGELQ